MSSNTREETQGKTAPSLDCGINETGAEKAQRRMAAAQHSPDAFSNLPPTFLSRVSTKPVKIEYKTGRV